MINPINGCSYFKITQMPSEGKLYYGSIKLLKNY